MARICVFCGSTAGINERYVDAARELGTALVQRGLGLVYGGGSIGLMGAIADTVVGEGGEVIGVIPEDLLAREVGSRMPSLRYPGEWEPSKSCVRCSPGPSSAFTTSRWD